MRDHAGEGVGCRPGVEGREGEGVCGWSGGTLGGPEGVRCTSAVVAAAAEGGFLKLGGRVPGVQGEGWTGHDCLESAHKGGITEVALMGECGAVQGRQAQGLPVWEEVLVLLVCCAAHQLAQALHWRASPTRKVQRL